MAARVGAALMADENWPDIALVSNAVRAEETWTVARESFPKCPVEFRLELYNAGPETVLAAARARAEATVLVIGHNPGLQALALDLLRQQGTSAALAARVEARFPPATAATFSFDADGRPELERLLMGTVG